jgi:hypothetical protein
MKIPASMRSFVYDTQRLDPSGSTAFFADEGDRQAESAAGWPEDTLVTWLFSRLQFRTMLCAELGLSDDARWRTGIRTPFLQNPNQKPGDIDLLLVDPAQPQAAVVMETKRVKVRPGSQGPQTITKLAGFGKGMLQANALLDCGFARTYLTMFAVVDGRHATESNFLFRGLGSDSVRIVLETPDWQSLRPGIGVLYVEVVQPVGRPVDEAGMICLAQLHPAQPREQSVDMTSRIVHYFELGGNPAPGSGGIG